MCRLAHEIYAMRLIKHYVDLNLSERFNMTSAIEMYNKLAKRHNGLEAYQFAKDLAEMHFKFVEDVNVRGKILCAVVTPKDNGLAYLYFGVDPQIYVRDKYQIMRDHGIQEGEVYLPLEFKALLN